MKENSAVVSEDFWWGEDTLGIFRAGSGALAQRILSWESGLGRSSKYTGKEEEEPLFCLTPVTH